VPILAMNLNESLHVLALAFDPGSPTVELAGALGAVEIDLIADDDAHAPILALAIDRDVDLALKGVEAESLGDLDKLEFLLLGELVRKTEGSHVIEQGLLLDLGGGKGRPLSGLGGEC